MYKIVLTVLSLGAAPALAQCPALPDQTAQEDLLFRSLATAESYNQGRVAISDMWMHWRKAPDEPAQELLDAGLEAIRYGDYVKAEDVLSRLVGYCPMYAEGLNQLAFVYFLKEQDAKSLDILQQALELEPRHFGVLSGMALIHIRSGRPALGQVFLRRAVAINPWLNERALLDAPVDGDDL